VVTLSVSITNLDLKKEVRRIAEALERPVWPLQLQAQLQLPQLADSYGLVEDEKARKLLSEVGMELPHKNMWNVGVPINEPSDLVFSDQISSGEAQRIMLQFHYLRSPRTDGRCYGLCLPTGQLIVMCYVSPLDISRLTDLLSHDGASPEQVRVISRVFAFEGAARNSISYLLSRVGYAEKSLGTTDLITYVNPNMGFSGASYRASGWMCYAEEPCIRYCYLDNRYVTDRELARRYGDHGDDSYRQLLSSQFTISTMPLFPLLIFRRRLSTSRREA